MRYLRLAVLILFTMYGAAFAQNVPPGSEPGALDKRYEKDVERQRKTFTTKPLKAPEIDIEKGKETPSQETASFILKDVKVEGSTIFNPQDFRAAYDKYLFKEVVFGDIEVIINGIKAKYKEKGYLTTSAYLPEQEIRDGVVTIKIVEGKAGELKTEGTKWFPSGLIKKYIHLKKNELLNILSLERDIIRLNKNADVEVKTVISAGAKSETSDVTLKVKDYFPYHFGASADNQGTRLVGQARAMLSFRSSDLTGNNDSLYTSYLFSKWSNAQSVSYVFPLDTYGTKMGFSYSHFHMRLGKEFKDARITGDTQTLGGYITKELYLSSEAEAYLTAGLDVKSTKKHLNGVTSSDDQMRIPYFGVDVTKNDSFGSTTISPRFDFGTGHFLGASSYNYSAASRPDTGGFFFKYEQGVTRVQRMFLESYSIIKFQAQAATETLAPSEQMQIGGAGTVRGYPEGDFLCDTGAILNFDWLFPLYPMPESIKLPYSDVPLRRQFEPLLFVDLGGGRLNKAQPTEMRDKFLAGFGGGIRVRLYKNLFCRFEWAKDIGSKPTAGSGPSTFHFSVQSEI